MLGTEDLEAYLAKYKLNLDQHYHGILGKYEVSVSILIIFFNFLKIIFSNKKIVIRKNNG